MGLVVVLGQDEVDDMTNIHTFDISVPGVTTYTVQDELMDRF